MFSYQSTLYGNVCSRVCTCTFVFLCLCVRVVTARISGWERLAQQFNDTTSNPVLQFDCSITLSLYNPCYYHQVHYEVKAHNRLLSELPSLGYVINSHLKSSFEWIFYLSEHIIRYSSQLAIKKRNTTVIMRFTSTRHFPTLSHRAESNSLTLQRSGLRRENNGRQGNKSR